MITDQEIIKDYYDILGSLKSTKKLSEILPSVLILAKRLGNEELEKWTQLEMSSYFNSNQALTKDTIVPEYRIVVGQYYDMFKRPLIIDDPDLSFINRVRMRNSAAELEKLATSGKLLSIKDPSYTKLINEKLHVDVHAFYFPSTSIDGILQNIRNILINKLFNISQGIEKISKTNGEIKHSLNMSIENLHPLVKSTAGKLYADGHYRQAILDTYILLTEAVKTKSGRHDLDGSALMQTVFSVKNPTIKISNDPDEQLGFMWMFSGAIMGIRNPKAHKLIQQPDPQKTIEWLSFASVLLRVLDDAEVFKPQSNNSPSLS